jgi:hypothetical protein
MAGIGEICRLCSYQETTEFGSEAAFTAMGTRRQVMTDRFLVPTSRPGLTDKPEHGRTKNLMRARASLGAENDGSILF